MKVKYIVVAVVAIAVSSFALYTILSPKQQQDVNQLLEGGKDAFYKGDYETAIKRLGMILEQDPNNHDALLFRGHSLAALERYDDAKRDYQQMINVYPEDIVAMHSLGDVYYRQGNWNDAAIWYDRAIEVQPEANYPQLRKGDLLRVQGLFDQAVPHYEQVLSSMPADDPLYSINTCLAKKGKEYAINRITEPLPEDYEECGSTTWFARSLEDIGK